jgi:hypothetical protein
LYGFGRTRLLSRDPQTVVRGWEGCRLESKRELFAAIPAAPLRHSAVGAESGAFRVACVETFDPRRHRHIGDTGRGYSPTCRSMNSRAYFLTASVRTGATCRLSSRSTNTRESAGTSLLGDVPRDRRRLDRAMGWRCDRDVHALEEHERLRHAILEHLEIVLRQMLDEAAVAVAQEDRDLDDLDQGVGGSTLNATLRVTTSSEPSGRTSNVSIRSPRASLSGICTAWRCAPPASFMSWRVSVTARR